MMHGQKNIKLSVSCAHFLEIWKPQPPGTPRAFSCL